MHPGSTVAPLLRGRAVELTGQSRELWNPVPADNIRMAQSLYSRARDLDPEFAAARARLALAHTLAAASYDPSAKRREHARLEAEAALRLQPGLPEAHQALASYWELEGDVSRAIHELQRAVDGDPDSAELHLALGSLLQRASRFDEAVERFEHATRLEPTSSRGPLLAAVTYSRLRRREEALRSFDRAAAADPDYHMVRVIKGQAYLRWYGVPDTLAAVLDRTPAGWDPDGMATYGHFTALWAQRRHADALAMLDRSRSKLSRDGLVYQPISLMRARILEDLGDLPAARRSFAAVSVVLEDSVRANPGDPSIRVSLGLAYAGLGRHTEAVEEARRAVDLAPLGSSTPAATSVMGGAVEVLAVAGELDDAFDLLELLFSMPAGREVTIPYLRVWPGFDPLRHDPRFDELVGRFPWADREPRDPRSQGRSQAGAGAVEAS